MNGEHRVFHQITDILMTAALSNLKSSEQPSLNLPSSRRPSRMQDRRLSVYIMMLADLGFGSNWAKPVIDLRAAFLTPPNVSVLFRQCQHKLPLIPCRRPPPTTTPLTLSQENMTGKNTKYDMAHRLQTLSAPMMVVNTGSSQR